jgi:surface antigen
MPVRAIDLASYTSAEPALSANAHSLRVAGIQQALERDVSGQPTTWSDPTTGDAGDVLPLRTVRSAQYGWCRDFTEHIRADGRVYDLQGTGCRGAAGVWDIIALEPRKPGSS